MAQRAREATTGAAGRQPAPSRPQATSMPSLPRLVDVEAVADALRVSVRHVRRLVFERRIPFVKAGAHLRFDAEEIRTWIEQRRVAELADLADHGRAY